MFIRFIIALVIAFIGITAYFFAKLKYKKEQNNWKKSFDFIENNVDKMIEKGLPLVGTAKDNNSDVEVSKAVKMINLPNDARIVIYD